MACHGIDSMSVTAFIHYVKGSIHIYKLLKSSNAIKSGVGEVNQPELP